MLQLLGTIVVGGIIGWVASIIAKANDQMGCLWNILVGVVGAFLGNWLAEKVFHYAVSESSWNWPRFGVGVGGAVVLIILLKAIGILRRKR